MLENGEELDYEALGIDPNHQFALPKILPGEKGYEYRKGDDVQLDFAIDLLTSGD